MARKIKLSEPGDQVILLVTDVAIAKGNLGEDLAITGDLNGESLIVYVPKGSADRQLARINVSDHELIGEHVRISRSTELGKNRLPYWNLDLAKIGEGSKAPPKSKRITQADIAPDANPFPPQETGAPPQGVLSPLQHPGTPVEQNVATKRRTIEADYLALVDRVAQRIAQECFVGQDPETAETFKAAKANVHYTSAQPIAATIWLTWKDKGLLV